MGVSLELPTTFHSVELFGSSIFLSVEAQPDSIKYPFAELLGFNKTTFSEDSILVLYFLNVKSSITAPFNDIDPKIFSFSTLILLFTLRASILDIFLTLIYFL